MRRAALVAAALAAPSGALAQTPRALDVGVAVGVARPFGAAQTGARLTDETFGAATLGLDVAYRFGALLSVGVGGTYGAGVPTLCASAGDCVSSLGSSVELRAFVRVALPAFGAVRPYASVGLGWEWWTSRLWDDGARASRGYDGPAWLSGEIGLPFALSRRVTLGPVLGFGLGTFVGAHLSTPDATSDGATEGLAVHGWVSLAARLAFTFGPTVGAP